LPGYRLTSERKKETHIGRVSEKKGRRLLIERLATRDILRYEGQRRPTEPTDFLVVDLVCRPGRIPREMVGAVIIRVWRIEGVRWDTGAFAFSVIVVGAAFDENDRDMVGGEGADVAITEIEGGEMDVLDKLVEVEEGVCRTARRVLGIGGGFEKSEYLFCAQE
jgi:hypothetical protein